MQPERFLRVLTLIHMLGSIVLVGMTMYLAAGGDAARLAASPGARILVDAVGPRLPMFFAGLAAFLAALAWGFKHRRRWAWVAALAAYSLGVAGSAWELSIGIPQARASLAIDSAVVVMLLQPSTRAAFASAGRAPARQDPPS